MTLPVKVMVPSAALACGAKAMVPQAAAMAAVRASLDRLMK